MKQIFIISVFLLVSFGGISQIKWTSKISETIGYTNNLYLAPKTYTGIDTTSITDFLKNELFNRLSFSNDVKFTFKKKRYLIVSPWIQSTNYLKERQANAMLYKLVADYKTPLSKKFDLNVGLTLEKNKKLTIDILTDDGANAYDYLLFAPNALLTYKINSNFKLEFSNMVGNKTYKPMQSGQDFSHWYHTHNMSGIYRYKLKHIVQVDLKYHKQFFDYLKMDTINNQPIQWRYLTIHGSYKYKINKDKFITVFSQFYKKNDFNKADFTFWQWSNGLTGEWKVKKIGFSSSLNTIYRNYLKRTAYIATNVKYDSTLLKYTYLNAAISVKYYIKDNFEVFASVFAEKRITNSTREDKKYRRPYETYTITIGFLYNLQLENKKEKLEQKKLIETDELIWTGTANEESQVMEEEQLPEKAIELIQDPESIIDNSDTRENSIDQQKTPGAQLVNVNFSDEMFINIELETGKNSVNEAAVSQLKLLSQALIKNKNVRLQISGYTDNIGLNEDNLELSKKRAERVAAILYENGVDKDQIIIVYFGEENPIATNLTPEGRKKNRRVELILIK